MQNQSPQPVAFDIDIKKSPAKSLPIKEKLEKQGVSDFAPTLDTFEKKLETAEQLRMKELEQRKVKA